MSIALKKKQATSKSCQSFTNGEGSKTSPPWLKIRSTGALDAGTLRVVNAGSNKKSSAC